MVFEYCNPHIEYTYPSGHKFQLEQQDGENAAMLNCYRDGKRVGAISFFRIFKLIESGLGNDDGGNGGLVDTT